MFNDSPTFFFPPPLLFSTLWPLLSFFIPCTCMCARHTCTLFTKKTMGVNFRTEIFNYRFCSTLNIKRFVALHSYDISSSLALGSIPITLKIFKNLKFSCFPWIISFFPSLLFNCLSTEMDAGMFIILTNFSTFWNLYNINKFQTILKNLITSKQELMRPIEDWRIKRCIK